MFSNVTWARGINVTDGVILLLVSPHWEYTHFSLVCRQVLFTFLSLVPLETAPFIGIEGVASFTAGHFFERMNMLELSPSFTVKWGMP